MKTKQSFPINPFVFCHLFFVLILSSFIFYLSSCQRSTAPIYSTQTLELSVVDVSCTETWLQLKTEQTEKAENDLVLQVFRDDSLVVNKNWGAGDSLVYLDGLQPNTSYAFSAKLLQDNKLLAASPKVTATTMDTTSHDFTWQTYEFGGEGGSSSFYDVAIIDENDIWAVGEIYTADDKYNAAHWNGEKWELKKIDWDGYVSRLTCIFAFSSNDVWFGVTNLIHWNGNRFEKNINPVLNHFYSKTVNKIWGTSDNDLYIVGNEGLIAHYDGQQWQRIESGTDLPIMDIKGNVYGIYAVAVKKFHTLDPLFFHINGQQIKGYSWPYSYLKKPYSLWLNQNKIYLCGSEIFLLTIAAKTINVEIIHHPLAFLNTIGGSAANNIFTAGSYGYIYHFNGIHWKLITNRSAKYFLKTDVKNNVAVFVGLYKNRGLIQMAK